MLVDIGDEGEPDFSADLFTPSELSSDAGLLSGLEDNDLLNNDLLNNSGSDYAGESDLEQNNLLDAYSDPQGQSDQSLISENISSLNDSFEPAKPI